MGLSFFEMQPELSMNHISSSTNFWNLSGMGYGLHAIGGPVVGMYISSRLVLQTSVGDFDMIESNLSLAMLKVGLKLPEEPEHPLVILTAYSDYLV